MEALLHAQVDARRFFVALAVVLVGSVVLPAAASAATVTQTGLTNSDRIDITDGADEVNNIRIVRDVGIFVITDAVPLTVAPGTSCTGGGTTTVTCPDVGPTGNPIIRFSVHPGNGSDVVTNDTEVYSQVNGGAGEDFLYGGSGPDLLFDGPGVDHLFGRGGNDRLESHGTFIDHISCGDGIDTAVADASDEVAADCENVDDGTGGTGGGGPGGGGAVGTTPSQNIVPPSLSGGACETRIAGTEGDDSLTGTGGGDFISALAGDDVVRALGGDDCVFGERGRDRLNGGTGVDFLKGHSGADRLRGGGGADRLAADSGKDSVAGGGGADLIGGGGGADSLGGGGGADKISGDAGSDRVSGGSGADAVSGGSGKDNINVARGGRDRVDCGSGRDVVRADAGDVVASDCERVIRVG
jgi:Ca2+-binding RTX toxin-like protein